MFTTINGMQELVTQIHFAFQIIFFTVLIEVLMKTR